MINRFRLARAEFPPQYWILFFGLMISFTGACLVWPYLLIHISRTLDLPLSSITWLLTLNYGVGLISSFIAGPIADRFGRKPVIVVSLLVNGLAYLLYTQAQTLAAFAAAGALTGLMNPIYKVGANAMISDMIRSEKRAEAFALMRMSNNIAVVIGPPLGGYLVTGAYDWAFIGAAAGALVYGITMIVLGRDTLPNRIELAEGRHASTNGYRNVLRDHHFLGMVSSHTLTFICAGIMWTLLSIYTNSEFGLLEKAFGWIPMTNALMVVFLQVLVTRQTRRHSPLIMLSLGSFFFAIGVGSVALGETFWAFWLSMVVMSIGELIVVPTADTYVARLAPIDMRGRYMSIAGLAWTIGNGIGPLMGGYLSDTFDPTAIWYGGFAMGASGAIGYLMMEIRKRRSIRIGDRSLAQG